jgi:DNA-binding transcriptional MocR family regulator
LGDDGRLDPSHASLAALAAVSVATVQRALDRLRDLGLLGWARRLVRDAASGWRAAQASNAYWLTPERETPAFACDLQTARAVKLDQTRKAAVDEVRRVAPEDRLAALAMLAAIRVRRERTLGLA